ncbi:MAG: hypothetical protein HUJ56_11020, partial [Erysipelotrichaceae bacterium]|nr:hypothetical protein [Erysipelotrichaceae bacterium]
MSQGFKKIKEEILSLYKLGKGEMMFIVFPLVFVYLEVVLALSTRGSFIGSSFIYITLFSMAYGLCVYLVCSLCNKEIMNKLIAGIFLFVICTGYTMIYLLFCEFQLFYDLNTMLAGASDAAGSFSGDIIGIIATPSGFIHVILFFMPLILYLVSIKEKKVGIHSISWGQRRMIIVIVISLILGNIIGIYSDSNVRSAYGES